MLHTHRTYGVGLVETPEELAKMLTAHTWTRCTGFSLVSHPQYVFLNDSFSEDGAQEYAVIKLNREGTVQRQLESITFGWCSLPQALRLIREVVAGAYDDQARPVAVRIEPARGHRCPLCA